MGVRGRADAPVLQRNLCSIGMLQGGPGLCRLGLTASGAAASEGKQKSPAWGSLVEPEDLVHGTASHRSWL